MIDPITALTLHHQDHAELLRELRARRPWRVRRLKLPAWRPAPVVTCACPA